MIWLKPRVVLLALGSIALLGLLSLGQEANRRWQYRQEVAQLQAEAQELEAKVIEMQYLNNYFRTDEYQERLAREKLNFSAEGEKVVLVPQEEVDVEVKSLAVDQLERDYENWELWWRVIFVDQ